jgi:hypothetical protein
MGMVAGYQQPLSDALSTIAMALVFGGVSLLIVLDVGGVATRIGNDWAARHMRHPYRYLLLLRSWRDEAFDPHRQRFWLRFGAGAVVAVCVLVLILEAVAIAVNGLR